MAHIAIAKLHHFLVSSATDCNFVFLEVFELCGASFKITHSVLSVCRIVARIFRNFNEGEFC